MSGNHPVMLRSEFTFNDMKICPADTTGTHTKENLSGLRFRLWDAFNQQGP
jgi:hypothetical protein